MEGNPRHAPRACRDRAAHTYPGGEMNILAGQVQAIGGENFGVFLVGVRPEAEHLARVRAMFAARNVRSEVVGYVP